MSNRTAITFLAAAMIVGIAVFVAAFWPGSRPRFLQPPEMRLVQAEKDYWDTRFDQLEETISDSYGLLWSAVGATNKEVDDLATQVVEIKSTFSEIESSLREVQKQEAQQQRVEDAE